MSGWDGTVSKVTGPANVPGVQIKFGATRDTSACPIHGEQPPTQEKR